MATGGGCPFGYGGDSSTPLAAPVQQKPAHTPATSNPSHPDEKLREHQTGLYYSDYLQLHKILSAQTLESEKKGRPSHDEHLFIVIHQTYELWFKQILWELDSVRAIFMQPYIGEKELGTAIARMERIVEIQKVLVQQVHVLETLRPQDFLDFRELLYPASGFQSYQFRLFENKLGLFAERTYENKPVYYYLKEEHQKDIRNSAHEPSLVLPLYFYDAISVELVQRWLERIPFLDQGQYHFWQAYKEAAEALLSRDKTAIQTNPLLNEEQRAQELKNHESNEASFKTIWDAEEHQKLVAQGRRRLSHKATLAALLIFLYRDEPLLQAPYRFLSLAQDIDEGVSLWRFRHMQMTQRMIGTKIGTGGSSGYAYLQKTVRMESYKVFVDLFNLSTFLLPRSVLPPLPDEVKHKLQFVLSAEKKDNHNAAHAHANNAKP